MRILAGDCRDVLPTLPAGSFNCIVTSPPYWGQRDYGVDGQIGLEPTLDGYVEAIAGVARELWRVLRSDGTFWLNLGDCYAAGTSKGYRGANTTRGKEAYRLAGVALGPMTQPNRMPQPGLKPKDLAMVPARVALRLQADGWWLRSEIVWAKPNPRTESVRDRPTQAHERVFLLTKSRRYRYDAAAIAEPITDLVSLGRSRVTGRGQCARSSARGNDRDQSGGFPPRNGKRNARNVWTITPKSYRGAHSATMPPGLAERCIKAGCPAGGHVLDPFGGAGTTGLVAEALGRHATLIELNAAYCGLAQTRCA